MNDEDLRDCCAVFALLGIVFAHKGEDSESASLTAYEYADAMLKVRSAEPEQEVGIVAAKPRRKKSA
jgi:hypothetical protein